MPLISQSLAQEQPPGLAGTPQRPRQLLNAGALQLAEELSAAAVQPLAQVCVSCQLPQMMSLPAVEQLELPTHLPCPLRFWIALPLHCHWLTASLAPHGVPLAITRPAVVSQHAPLEHPHCWLASAQQLPPGLQPAAQRQPLLLEPPHTPAHEPTASQVGVRPLPFTVHWVLAGHVCRTCQSPGTPLSALSGHELANLPLQPWTQSRFLTSAPSQLYSVVTMVLPHTVPAGLTLKLSTSQQTPEVQQPGLSTTVHSPTDKLQLPILQGVPSPGQSLSMLQQPFCLVPLQVPAAVQMSLKVHALPSSQ